jgi:cellulose synthase/poly-beta-1,6-N-acetylglucosamine synthase-like glycosyltransferase
MKMLIQLLLAELGLTCAALIAVPYVIYFSFMRQHARRQPPRTSMAHAFKTSKVSIIVCTLNAVEHVEMKFQDILHQTYPLANLEVIAVDGGSADGTAEALRMMKDRLSGTLAVALIEDSTLVGKASQINRGLQAADGDVVITSDADVRIGEAAVQALVESLAVGGVGASCARQVLTNLKDSWVVETEATYRGFYETLRIGESKIHSTPIFHGGLSAYRKEAIAPIAEDVNADDTQLALAAIRKGFRAIYEPSSVFYTDSPHGFRDAMRQRVRRAQGIQRVFWRNYDMLNPQKFGLFFLIFLGQFYIHLISPPLFWVSVISLALSLTFLAPPFTIGLFAVVAFIGLILWRNKHFPASFLTSLLVYMSALMLAMFLHLIGYNYARWSRNRPTRS